MYPLVYMQHYAHSRVRTDFGTDSEHMHSTVDRLGARLFW